MKKLILLSAIFSLLTTKAMAQESVPSSTGSTTPSSQESSNSTQTKKEKREQRYQKASPEQKAKMDQHREMMKNLSPEKKELVKKEMDRHRAEMINITGVDLPMPMNPNGPNNK